MWQGMHEIYAAGRLCPISCKIEFEVSNPDKPGNNFDILANIEGTDVNFEVTTRQDNFPAINGKTHIRATVSPANSNPIYDKNKITYHKNPESDVLRGKLLDKAIKQLPRSGINVIVLGYDGISNIEWHIMSALFGDPKYLHGKDRLLEKERVQDGLFVEKDFTHIATVIHVSPYSGYGKIYLNPNASEKLPLLLQKRLEETF
jgi:hypothetical protein